MDLRNDLMKVVYPFTGTSKETFVAEAKKHVEGSKGHFGKLEGFCKGTYICGPEPQSGDFHVFEMIDQHIALCEKLGLPNVMDEFPMLTTMHATMKADPKLSAYFEHDFYTKYPHNNPLVTFHTCLGDDYKYGPTVKTSVTF